MENLLKLSSVIIKCSIHTKKPMLTISMPVMWCNFSNNLRSTCVIVLFKPWAAAPILPAAIMEGG